MLYCRVMNSAQRLYSLVIGVILGALVLQTPLFAQIHHPADIAHSEIDTSYGCKPKDDLCVAPQFAVATQQLQTLTMPPYERASVRAVTYSVETRGVLTASLDEFKKQANETLNDTRGWARLGVTFKEIATGGDFTLVLSEASQVPSFSPQGCDSEYSCNVGRYVIINQDRWLGATASWNDGGGSIRDYRHMVVNHETGHWLGQGHENCSGAGQPAAVMQQQSMDLQGCRFNPWPLESELYAPTLGL